MDLGHIYIFSPDKKISFKVFALNFEYADGLSLKQHKRDLLVMKKKLQHKYYMDILKLFTSTNVDIPEIKNDIKGKIERFFCAFNKANFDRDTSIRYTKK